MTDSDPYEYIKKLITENDFKQWSSETVLNEIYRLCQEEEYEEIQMPKIRLMLEMYFA